MSRRRIAFLATFFLFSLSGPALSATEQFLSVQVKQGPMRGTPTFLGSITATLAYGDRVKVLGENGPWKKVTIGKLTGWMHISALTTKAIALQAGKNTVKSETTDKELSLAGKGFNARVEEEFKKKNNLDYAAVDKMEAAAVKPADMQAFLKAGRVEVPEGGQR